MQRQELTAAQTDSLSSIRIWDWIQCVYDVKKVTNDTETTWNLAPSITLVVPSEQSNVQPKINFKLELSRPFIYSEGVGWNWHKSWNMPDINCELEIRDPVTLERLVPLNKIYAELQIVKTVANPMQTFHLFDVGVKGNPRVDLENGKCILQGLKFDTTSYNHEVFDYITIIKMKHAKFHIVVTLYLTQNKFEFPQILESRISPPIFVDSRKSARDLGKQKKQRMCTYFDPFLPETVEKQFIKRDSKFKFSNEEEISSNLDGFISYFSAPNIRHKVKHPLFLAIKFGQCLSLWANSNHFTDISNDENTIEAVQKVLYDNSSQSASVQSKLDQKPLILVVDSLNSLSQSSAKSKKVVEFLEPLKNDTIEVLIDPVQIPKCFKKIDNRNGELINNYRRVYGRLLNQKFEGSNNGQPNMMDFGRRMDSDEEYKDRIRKIIQIQGPEIKKEEKEIIKQEPNACLNVEVQVFQHEQKEPTQIKMNSPTVENQSPKRQIQCKKETVIQDHNTRQPIQLTRSPQEKLQMQFQQQQLAQFAQNSQKSPMSAQIMDQMNHMQYAQNQMLQLAAYQQWIQSQMGNPFLYQQLISQMQAQQKLCQYQPQQ